MTALPKVASAFLRMGVRGSSGRGSGTGAEITGSFSVIGTVLIFCAEVDVVEMEVPCLDESDSLVSSFFDDESADSSFISPFFKLGRFSNVLDPMKYPSSTLTAMSLVGNVGNVALKSVSFFITTPGASFSCGLVDCDSNL